MQGFCWVLIVHDPRPLQSLSPFAMCPSQTSLETMTSKSHCLFVAPDADQAVWM